MTTLTNFLLCAGVICLALACGGGTSSFDENSNRSSTGARTILLEGSIDDATQPSKPRWAGGNSLIHTGLIFDLNNNGQKWDMSINDTENYTAEIIRRSDVAVEVYRNNVLALSRVMHEEETLVNTRAKVNTITHLQASMARALLNEQGTGLKLALENINQSLFGKTVLNESEYTLDNLSENQGDLKAMMATYGQLFRSPNSTGFTALITKLNQSIGKSASSEVISGWLNLINGLTDQNEIDAYASAHEGAKNSRITGANLIFSGLTKRFTSTSLLAAIEDAKVAPVFGANVDTVRQATIGALFQYTFPRATTNDILGIASYKGFWLAETPLGVWRSSADEGRTLQFLPDAADIGKTFHYGLTVEGGNGKITAATNIMVVVKSPLLTPMARRPLPSRPLLGPIVDKEFLYLVSSSESGLQFYLNKFSHSDLQSVSGEDVVIPYHSWELPTSVSSVTDLHLNLNTLYVSTGKAAYGFDASFSGKLLSNIKPTHSNTSFGSSQQVVVGNEIIHYYSGNVQKTDLELGGNTILSAPTTFFTSIGNTTVLSGNTSLYGYNKNLFFVAGNTQHQAYFFNSSGNVQLLDTFSPMALTPTSNPETLPALPIVFVQASDNLITQWLPGDDSIRKITLSANHVADKRNPHGVSSNLLLNFTTDTTTGANQLPTYTLQGNSLSANTLNFSESSEVFLKELHFGDNPEGLKLNIHTPSTGAQNDKSGSWIYNIGNDGLGSGNWFIQAHLLQPGN